MILRVITGTARGRKLTTPAGLDTRPTTDMVKESMFSIVQFEVEGARVLDLFAGSGQLGIEALSRGAKQCVFVDSDKAARDAISQNLTSTGFAKSAVVLAGDAFTYLTGTRDEFDLALLDAPYNKGMLVRALPLLEPRMSDAGILICESELREELPETVGRFSIRRDYRYGKIKLTVYRREEQQ